MLLNKEVRSRDSNNNQQVGIIRISNNNTVEETTNPEVHMVTIAVVQDIIKDITANMSMAMVTKNLIYKRPKMDNQYAIDANNLDI